MVTLSKNCVDKKKLLLMYAPGTAIDISEITTKMGNLDGEGGRWDDFEIALEAYNDIIEGQKEVLKSTLDDEEIQINVDIDRCFFLLVLFNVLISVCFLLSDSVPNGVN
jgi:hypothetical protein